MLWPLMASLLALALGGSLLYLWHLTERLRAAQGEHSRLVAEVEQARCHGASLQATWNALGQIIPDALVVVAPNRTVTFLNPAGARFLNCQEWMDKPLSDVARDHELDLIVRHAMEAREGVTEQIVLAPGGVVAEVRVMPVDSEGRQLGAVVIIRDITELQRLGRVRRDFIANISHELRSPLTSIKLLIDTLRNGALSRPRIAAEMISRIDQEVDALVELVEELLELSRIESGRSTFLLAATDLEPAIRTVVDRLAPQAQRKGVGVDLDLSGLSPALADSDRFARAFMNLLHNAIKFTPDGGHITITGRTITIPGPTARAIDADRVTIPSSGRPSLEPGTWVIVSVADTGIGIPREDLPRIFERFYKVDRARQRGDRGTGLGLAIARHIVEGHGGAIWAESIEGRGSTFYVALRGDEGGKAHA